MISPQHTSWRRAVGEMFTFGEARSAGIPQRVIYQLRDSGDIISLGSGLYRWEDSRLRDIDLVEVAERTPHATMCLETALARHGLIDSIPTAIDIALPRGLHRPRFTAPVRLHAFDAKTFEIGREMVRISPSHRLGIYSPERCVIDVVRLRHAEGQELAWEALRAWIATRGRNPAALLALATKFHGAQQPLRLALQILL